MPYLLPNLPVLRGNPDVPPLATRWEDGLYMRCVVSLQSRPPCAAPSSGPHSPLARPAGSSLACVLLACVGRPRPCTFTAHSSAHLPPFPVSAPPPPTTRLTSPVHYYVTPAGSFTHWQKMPMQWRQTAQGGEWFKVVDLATGSHQYKFIIDGQV